MQLNLPLLRPKWADITDAGPGVGVSNFEVRFRDAEFARIHSRDYLIRVHRSREDSGQNKAERTNSATGDNVVDGETINWNFYKKFDDVSDAKLEKFIVAKYEAYEKERMEKNAWHVASIVRERVDDAPALSTHLVGFLAEKKTTSSSIKSISKSILLCQPTRKKLCLDLDIHKQNSQFL